MTMNPIPIDRKNSPVKGSALYGVQDASIRTAHDH